MNLDDYKAMKVKFASDPERRNGQPMMAGHRDGEEVIAIGVRSSNGRDFLAMASYLAAALSCDVVEHCMDAYVVTASSTLIKELLADGKTFKDRHAEGHPAVHEGLIYTRADLDAGTWSQESIGYFVNEANEVIWESLDANTYDIGLGPQLLRAMQTGAAMPLPKPVTAVVNGMMEERLPERHQRIVLDAIAMSEIPTDLYEAVYMSEDEEEMGLFMASFSLVSEDRVACPGCENCRPDGE